MPFAALALAKILRLDESMGIGLLLLGMAGGAPFLPKLAQIAKGNLAFAVGLMVLLMVVTVGYLPLVLPLPAARACPWTRRRSGALAGAADAAASREAGWRVKARRPEDRGGDGSSRSSTATSSREPRSR